MTITIDTTDFSTRSWKYWMAPEVVNVDDLETVYRRKGRGETVVYLHGGGNTRAWLPFHEAMAESVDFIAPEHPGFGDTPRPPYLSDWDDWILHYDGFFRALGLDRVHLVGNSLGGLLAAKLAVHYPDRFKTVTLLTPVGLRITGEPLRNVYRWSPEEANKALFNGRIARYQDYLVQ